MSPRVFPPRVPHSSAALQPPAGISGCYYLKKYLHKEGNTWQRPCQGLRRDFCSGKAALEAFAWSFYHRPFPGGRRVGLEGIWGNKSFPARVRRLWHGFPNPWKCPRPAWTALGAARISRIRSKPISAALLLLHLLQRFLPSLNPCFVHRDGIFFFFFSLFILLSTIS